LDQKKQDKHEYLYQLRNIAFQYSLGSCKIDAIRDVSVDIKKNTLLTLSGPSGSGKSTLLNILGLIEPPQQGEALFLNEDISAMSAKQLNTIRKYQIGFIFQQFHLIPVFNAEENVAYFLARQGHTEEEINKRTRSSLEVVGLWDHRKKRPGELSGGQRQRLAIARALAKTPEVIIGDEPTASLDQQTGREIMGIFHELVKQKKVSIILSTHDAMVQSYADCNIHLHDGALK